MPCRHPRCPYVPSPISHHPESNRSEKVLGDGDDNAAAAPSRGMAVLPLQRRPTSSPGVAPATPYLLHIWGEVQMVRCGGRWGDPPRCGQRCYYRQPEMLPSTGCVATMGIPCTTLLPEVGGLATTGVRRCFQRRATLLPWVTGVRRCWRLRSALLPPV
jgi:hypothetical protein